MSNRNTRIEFVGEDWDNYSPPRKVRWYLVKDVATGATLYGPATWAACAAWKQGRPYGAEGIL